MAKKRKRDSSAHSGQGRRKQDDQGPPSLPDMRAIEGAMWGMFGLAGGSRGEDLGRAQELMYEAFEAPAKDQPKLARKALQISPDCADAYVLLAEHAATPEESLDLYQEGVAAGQRAIGKRQFRECEGEFWGVLETRPYMRARAGLAQTLAELGRHDEAVQHYREMLRLNPNDNQGNRYLLARLLLELNQDAELAELLDQYADDALADFTYTKALAAYRREGDSKPARQLLAKARKWNKHVPDYLVGNKPMPAEPPPYAEFGGASEAVHYVAAFRSAWRSTPGALSWLRKVLRVPLSPGEGKKPTRSPERVRQNVLDLPQQQGETWQVDVRRIAHPTTDEGDVWLLLVTSPLEDAPLQLQMDPERLTPSRAWDCLLQTMLKPKGGEPHRPSAVQVRRKNLEKSWKAGLEQLGIQCVLVDELDQIDGVLEHLLSLAQRHAEDLSLPASEFDPSRVDLTQFPQHAAVVWQAHARRYPSWFQVDGEPQRPWIAMVIDVTDDLVLCQDMTGEEPPEDWLWRLVARAVERPAAGDPHRPETIEVGSEAERAQIAPHVEPAGIRCVLRERLEKWDALLEDLAEAVGESDGMTALIDVPGMTLAQVGGFFAAAADFYRRAPWRRVPGDTVIRVQCDKYRSGTWHAVVMGQSGMVLGVAMYEDLRALQAILGGGASDEDNARRTSGLSVMFDEAFTIHPRDLDAAERHGWPVAGPEAYPTAIRVNPGNAVRPALAWELELLEGVMRAIPDFLGARQTSQTLTVPVASGTLALQLSPMDLP